MNIQEFLPIGAAIASFLVAGGLVAWVSKQSPGTKEMLEISNAVKVGAAAFVSTSIPFRSPEVKISMIELLECTRTYPILSLFPAVDFTAVQSVSNPVPCSLPQSWFPRIKVS